MVQPIQYTVQAPSAFESLVSGLKLGTSLQEMQAQNALRQQQAMKIQEEMEQKRKQQELLVQLRQKPFDQWTSEDVTSASMLMPKEGLTFLQNQMNQMSTEERRTRALTLGQLASVALAGDAERTAAAFDERIEAETNPREKEALRVQKQTALTRPGDLAKLYSVMLGGMGEEGKGVVANLIKLHALEPGALDDLRLKVAQADRAVAEAKTAQATAQTADQKAAADLRLANANATRAQIQTDYEERQQKADLEKKAQELGLTAAQKNKALAETSKLSAETKKVVLELAALEASGGVDPSKKFDQEEKLRKEFTARTKVFNEIDSTFSNLNSSAQAGTGPGDIALITGFMKMLDPGSVVRETEFATARDTAGLFTRLENSLQKLQNGEFLKPAQRQEYVNLAKQYYDAAKQKANIEKQSIAKVVTNYKLNPDNVFGVEAAPVAPGAAGAGQRNITQSFSQRPQSAPTPAQTPTPAAGGAQRNVKVDY